MNITFAPNDILQIEDARLVYKNFSGVGSKFNREGDRNFSLVIDDEDIKDELVARGWNVKIKAARDEDDAPFMHLPVKVKFNDRGPHVYLKTGSAVNKLSEDTIDCLDDVWMAKVDLYIRPYDWDVNGKEGRTAYLQAMDVIQEINDPFASRYEDNYDDFCQIED